MSGLSDLSKILTRAVTKPVVPTILWATVVSTVPLTVRRDGETTVVPASSSGAYGHAVGDRVQCIWQGTQLMVITNKAAAKRVSDKLTSVESRGKISYGSPSFTHPGGTANPYIAVSFPTNLYSVPPAVTLTPTGETGIEQVIRFKTMYLTKDTFRLYGLGVTGMAAGTFDVCWIAVGV